MISGALSSSSIYQATVVEHCSVSVDDSYSFFNVWAWLWYRLCSWYL